MAYIFYGVDKDVRHNSKRQLQTMKFIITFLFFIFYFSSAKADYGYLQLCEMLRKADYCALGTIINVDNNYFYFQVDKYLLNQLEKDTLQIIRFQSWECAKRYDEYKVGQKELVFFSKSNYVIDDYELLGYGGGDEYELPIFQDTIKYQSSFGKLVNYNLDNFLNAISDYDKLMKEIRGTSKTISKKDQKAFVQKSEIHKKLIECRSNLHSKEFEIPKTGLIVNLERNYLYVDYENKLYISTPTTDSIYLEVEDAEVWKQSNYYVVRPKSGWTRRWLSIYSVKDKNKKANLFQQIFEVIELPDPTLYFGRSIKDTINYSYYRDAVPSVGYYLDDFHKDENLEYKLLSYEYQIISNDNIETYKIKSEYGTKEFQDRLRKITAGDKISMSNIFVLYPDKKVKQIKNKTVIVRRK